MENPKCYLSAIINGTDQKKTNCPVMGRNIKGEFQLTQRVMGVKVHGIGTFVYVCDETVRDGAHLICDILCRTLNVLDSKGQLP